MKIALIAPDWGNSWIPLIQAEVERRGNEFAQITPANLALASAELIPAFDIFMHAWAGPPIEGKRNVMFLRRYELFNGALAKIDWEHVQDLILVNSWIKGIVDTHFKAKGIKTKTHLIYNAVDTAQWAYQPRRGNHRIGMACHVHPKKNLPLALELLAQLPPGYELHIAGAIQDSCTAEYLDHLGKALQRKVYLYGHIPRDQLNVWWEQFGFCLSTSISEGNPNNVLEAMAKGIKPLVLNWPGAEDQFPAECIGNSAQALAYIVMNTQAGHSPYDSAGYLALVESRFSLNNIKRAVDIALGVI